MDSSAPHKAIQDGGVRLSDERLFSSKNEGVVIVGGREYRVRGLVHKRANSRIYRGEGADNSAPIAIKVCLVPETSTPNREEAALQFTALNRVADCLEQQPHCGIPAPLGALTDRGIVVTEWVDGPSLTDFILSCNSPVSSIKESIRHAGVWLRCLHQCRRLGSKPLDVATILSQLDDISREAGSHFEADTTVRQAISLLQESASSVAAHEMERSWLHGDFKSDNLLLAKTGIVGIDVGLLYEDSVLHDVARFVNHLELIFSRPKGLRLLWRRTSLIDAFAHGYDGGGTGIAPQAQLWARLNGIIRLWAYQKCMASSSVRNIYLNQCYRRITRRLTAQLTRALSLPV